MSDSDPAPDVAAQIAATPITPGRPLLIVDIDEVVVHFAGDFARWLDEQGMALRLRTYSLEDAITDKRTGQAVARDRTQGLINDFITARTRRQTVMEGAIPALNRLSRTWFVLALTNAPGRVRQDREANLRDHGFPGPLIMNTGGKGRAVARLHELAQAPVAFIDDSAMQIDSVAKHAPEVRRIQFLGSEMLRAIAPAAETADLRLSTWGEIEVTLSG